jgi:membrane associated rhomboid family serine protease
MIPLKDNLRYSKFAWVSVTIFALNVLIYIGQMTLDTSGVLNTTISSWLPVRDVFTTGIATGDPWLIGRSIIAVFLAMFLHGSFSHIFGNMWFFFCFAPALEARMGHGRFAAFYLLSGIAATLTFLATDTSGVGHILGASGAIGGVLGAYVLYYPRARVDGMTPTFNLITTLSVFFLGEYLVMQWMSLWAQLGGVEEAAGVAFSAHIGGMAFGLAVAALMLLGDVGRLRWRDGVFYLAAFSVMTIAATASGFGSFPVRFVCALAVIAAIWLLLFQSNLDGWWKRLWTPIVATIVAAMSVTAGQLFVAALQRNNGFIQSLNFYGVCMLLMLASVVIAIAARRLPVLKKLSVTVPEPKLEERLMSEVAADLVVGFFRLVGSKLVAARDLAVAGGRFIWRWLGVGGTAVASGYRQYAPKRVQSVLGGLVKFAWFLVVGSLFLMLKLARLVRLHVVGKWLFVGYGRLRNRLSVTSV